MAIGRVDENEVETFGGQSSELIRPVFATDVCSNHLKLFAVGRIAEKSRDVPEDQFPGLAIDINKDNRCRPSAEGLQPQGTGAGEKVEYLGAINRAAKDTEKRLAGFIRGRPDGTLLGGRGEKGAASGNTANYSHSKFSRAYRK